MRLIIRVSCTKDSRIERMSILSRVDGSVAKRNPPSTAFYEQRSLVTKAIDPARFGRTSVSQSSQAGDCRVGTRDRNATGRPRINKMLGTLGNCCSTVLFILVIVYN